MFSRLRAYAELLRVSNVMTAVADVWMGMIVATGTLAPASVSVPLTLASVFLYLSGMVLNDVFDAEKDAKERPSRPIPSGRITLSSASRLGWTLLSSGLVAAGVAGAVQQHVGSLVVAGLLAFLVVFYNQQKSTPAGPLLMAFCRVFNVLLGFSASGAFGDEGIGHGFGYIFAGVFLYVIGLTGFARSEARVNMRTPLISSALVATAGLATFACWPILMGSPRPLVVPNFHWLLLWLVITMLIGRRYIAAIIWPKPKYIQSAVGNAIQGIILINAALAWGYTGPYWGLAILALLPPTMLMARFIPQT